MDKKLIREKNILLRKTFNQEDVSRKIVSKVKALDTFCRAKNVLIFYPLKYEINLLSLLEIKDKNYFLPRVEGNNLLICPYTDNLIKSGFGVMEPNTPSVDPEIIDLVFVPCLAIDKNLNRVGYGKGFYDRLFSNPDFRALKIAVINKELTNDDIDFDINDKKVDLFITD